MVAFAVRRQNWRRRKASLVELAHGALVDAARVAKALQHLVDGGHHLALVGLALALHIVFRLDQSASFNFRFDLVIAERNFVANINGYKFQPPRTYGLRASVSF